MTRPLIWLAPFLVLLLGLAATSLFTLSSHREMINRDSERFHYEVDQLVARLETRLKTYATALMGMRDWYYTLQKSMTAASWTNYINRMEIRRHYPGLHTVGYVEKVLDMSQPGHYPELEAHLARMRTRLGPQYRIHLPPDNGTANSWYQMPVIWHSFSQWRGDPSREYQHYGLDLNQNPDLWAAMNWALGEDRLALSGRWSVDSDHPELIGLLLFVPVYRALDYSQPDPPHALPMHKQHLSSEQLQNELNAYGRLNQLDGLLFGGIDITTFIHDQHVAGTNLPAVTFALFASTNQTACDSPAQLLFDNRPSNSLKTPKPGPGLNRNSSGQPPELNSGFPPALLSAAPWNTTRDIRLYGRVLHLVLEAGPGFSSSLNHRTLALATGFGVATTLLLSGFIAFQARANRKDRFISFALRQSEGRLQSLLKEREQMSRDLHDGTIQSLYAIGLGLGRMRRALADAKVQERLDASLIELDHVIAELRGYLTELTPEATLVPSPAVALGNLISRLRHTTATELRLTIQENSRSEWPLPAVLDILQAAREGVSNALRHGSATRVELHLHTDNVGAAVLTIADNGIGFDPAARRSIVSHGLSNIEKRARRWNGSLKIDSQPGGPTLLTVSLHPFTSGPSASHAPQIPQSNLI